jgi:hypothetical protein
LEPVIVKTPRLLKKFGIFGGSFFVVMSITLIILWLVKPSSPDNSFPWVVLFTGPFFGYCALSAKRQLGDDRPVLIVDDQGIFYRPFDVGVIPWSEITEVELVIKRRIQCIALKMRTPDVWYNKLSTLTRVEFKAIQVYRGLKFDELYINLGPLGCNPWMLCKVIENRIAETRFQHG